MISFTCRLEFLPMIEGALAANGYHIEIHHARNPNSTTARVLTRGLTTILLTDAPNQSLAAIEIWGMGQALAAQLLETLPIEVHKHAQVGR